MHTPLKHGSPEYQRDDALRRVSNTLHLELGRVRDEKAKAERALSRTAEWERQLLADIVTLHRVRTELHSNT